MSAIVNDHLSEASQVTLQAGQRISMKILNADGTVAQVVFDDNVPAGQIFTGVATYTGHMVVAS